MSDDNFSGLKDNFISHLVELRTRLVRASAVVLVVFIVLFAIWPGAAAIYDILAKPMMNALPEGSKMIATGVITPFMVPMKVTMAVALMVSLPWVLYQAWAFVAPGLYQHEKKFAIPFIVLSSSFFVGGAAFSHYVVFPMTWKFFVGFTTDYLTFMPRIAYWVGQGCRVLVVDHRGTTGHGRSFQQALNGHWGELDTLDVVAATSHAHAAGWGSPGNTIIMGGSAGGFVALNAAGTRPDLFAGVVALYPVVDQIGRAHV